jgi:hypothetical protein
MSAKKAYGLIRPSTVCYGLLRPKNLNRGYPCSPFQSYGQGAVACIPYRCITGPYRYLTGWGHAFRPMLMRVLTGLTGPDPQGWGAGFPDWLELAGPTGSYRDQENVKAAFLRALCGLCGLRVEFGSNPDQSEVIRSCASRFPFVPTFCVNWCCLVQFGALWS